MRTAEVSCWLCGWACCWSAVQLVPTQALYAVVRHYRSTKQPLLEIFTQPNTKAMLNATRQRMGTAMLREQLTQQTNKTQTIITWQSVPTSQDILVFLSTTRKWDTRLKVDTRTKANHILILKVVRKSGALLMTWVNSLLLSFLSSSMSPSSSTCNVFLQTNRMSQNGCRGQKGACVEELELEN